MSTQQSNNSAPKGKDKRSVQPRKDRKDLQGDLSKLVKNGSGETPVYLDSSIAGGILNMLEGSAPITYHLSEVDVYGRYKE